MTQAKLNVTTKKSRHTCSYILIDGSVCPSSFGSRRRLVQHLAIAHKSYERGDVASCTLEDMATVWQRTLMLLIRFPECRNPDNSGLYVKACYYYCGLRYDTATQSITDKDGRGIPYPLMMRVLKQLESYRRRRQEIQAEDRGLYHSEDGLSLEDHCCILPDAANQALATERAEVIHDYYADKVKARLELPNTYIDFSGA